MNSALLHDVCTLWHATGEVDRVKTWERHIFPCHWEPRAGSLRSADGDLSQYSLEMICNYPGVAKGDKLKIGVVNTQEPPKSSYTAVWVDALPLRGQVHHFEVYAR